MCLLHLHQLNSQELTYLYRMKRLSILCLVICSVLISCKKEPKVDQDQVLQDRFNGKYRLLSATSDQSVDVNMDGRASQDLLTEIPNLQNSYLELKFIERPIFNNKEDNAPLFIFSWQEQDLSYEYDKNKPWVYYVNQSYPFHFSFNSGNTEIISIPAREMTTAEAERFVVPKTLRILKDDKLQTSFVKKVYTNSGFKLLTIQLLYERWTSET
jgi:hypothetical protein